MASSTNEDDATQLTHKIDDLSINDTDVLTIICANCGKEVINPNTCNKCKAATYCNASCKKKHRSKHKKDVKDVWLSYMRKKLSAKGEQRSCMMGNYSNSLRHMKIVQFVCYLYQQCRRGQSGNHAVEKLYVADAFIQSE